MGPRKIQILGVLNVTPDSFNPESRVQALDEIVERALKFVREGADILDVGGESTGPKTKDVSLEEELRRVIPAVKALHKALPETTISVDTFKAEVAWEALREGASMINDVTAGRGDPHMLEVIAKSNALYVMMFAKDSSARTTIAETRYDDVIETIRDFLSERIIEAEKTGIRRERIIIDPGLGHYISSNPEYSWEILCSLERLKDLGPVLVSPSRKSFLAGPGNLPVKDRLPATLEATRIAVEHGASYIRTHDVLETKRTLQALKDSYFG